MMYAMIENQRAVLYLRELEWELLEMLTINTKRELNYQAIYIEIELIVIICRKETCSQQ